MEKKSLEELLVQYVPNVEIIKVQPDKAYESEEGNGRRHRAGGKACDYCSHCYGSDSWCPYLD